MVVIAYLVINAELEHRKRTKEEKKLCGNCKYFEIRKERPHLGKCSFFFKDCFYDSYCHRWRKKGVDDED